MVRKSGEQGYRTGDEEPGFDFEHGNIEQVEVVCIFQLPKVLDQLIVSYIPFSL